MSFICMSAIAVCSAEGTEHDPGLDVDHVRAINRYWAQLRLLYSPFEADLTGPDPEVYEHEIPGGQLPNLIFQASQLGLGAQWQQIQESVRAGQRYSRGYRQGHSNVEGFWCPLNGSKLAGISS